MCWSTMRLQARLHQPHARVLRGTQATGPRRPRTRESPPHGTVGGLELDRSAWASRCRSSPRSRPGLLQERPELASAHSAGGRGDRSRPPRRPPRDRRDCRAARPAAPRCRCSVSASSFSTPPSRRPRAGAEHDETERRQPMRSRNRFMTPSWTASRARFLWSAWKPEGMPGGFHHGRAWEPFRGSTSAGRSHGVRPRLARRQDPTESVATCYGSPPCTQPVNNDPGAGPWHSVC